MNLKQLQYIQEIAKEGSITAAAHNLYISQPSLSQMLRQVEQELGATLFERSSQPMRPTPAGERYLQTADTILTAYEQMETEIQGLKDENSGRLRLGISMQRSVHLLPKVLPLFLQQFPKVSLVLYEGGSTYLEHMVLEGEVDLALVSTQATMPGLRYQPLQQETVGILAGKDSPLAQRLPNGTLISLCEALDAPLVSLKLGHNVRVIQDTLFRNLGRKPTLLLETDNMEAARKIALSCGCYLLCTNSYLDTTGSFFPLKDYENNRHFYGCSQEQRVLPKYAVAFLDLVKACLTPHGLENFI